jgi:hypothetical protein
VIPPCGARGRGSHHAPVRDCRNPPSGSPSPPGGSRAVIDYQNRRSDYVKAWMESLVNWDFAATNLES